MLKNVILRQTADDCNKGIAIGNQENKLDGKNNFKYEVNLHYLLGPR